MKRNLGICGSVRKYSTSAPSELKKKNRRRAKANEHPERDWNLPDSGKDTNLQSLEAEPIRGKTASPKKPMSRHHY